MQSKLRSGRDWPDGEMPFQDPVMQHLRQAAFGVEAHLLPDQTDPYDGEALVRAVAAYEEALLIAEKFGQLGETSVDTALVRLYERAGDLALRRFDPRLAGQFLEFKW